MDLKFLSAFGLELGMKEVVAEILRFMAVDPRAQYKILIGTDSEQLLDKRADFVTAVVVHRVGNGGRYFWRRFCPPAGGGKFHTIRDRIIREVLLSLEVARSILTELKENQKSENWTFEIHADVGENGPTSALIAEVVGMIRASNFEAKTKPESYAASKVADRHV